MSDNFHYKIHQSFEPYIIAEIGANHNGDMVLAKTMIDEAKKCGCDCVKFQSWTTESLICEEEYERKKIFTDSTKKHFGSLKAMVGKYWLRPEQHKELADYCRIKDIDFASTPFSEDEVDLLESLDVPFYKIASMDIDNYRLLSKIARKKKPIVLATGMATIEEVNEAVNILKQAGNDNIILLHCVSVYPPNDNEVNLRNIEMLYKKFGFPVGYSDHTFGFSIALASVVLGAKVIEKHFTIDKSLSGWDHEISADPYEMEIIVKESKRVAYSLGNYDRNVSKAEEKKKLDFRRSAVASHNIAKGCVLSEEDIIFKRPGDGIHISEVKDLIGKRVKRVIRKDYMIHKEDIE